MSGHFRTGAKVRWNWGQGTGEGKVVECFERRVSRTIKNKRIVRVGRPANPAYLIAQDDGDRVLKRQSELSAV